MKENIYQQVEDCLIEDMDGELLLYNPSTAETLHLNGSSAFVFQSCDGNRSVAEIIAEAQATFPEQAEQIESDIEQVVTDLSDKKALRLVD